MPTELEQAMKTVIDAHEVLLQFHKEVVALWRLIDEQFADDTHSVQLKCASPDDYLRYTPDKLISPHDWAPKWLGRFYFDAAADRAESEIAAPADRFYNMAFVWIAAFVNKELPEFSAPECVFGVAHSGRAPKGVSAWNVARYGVWQTFDTASVAKVGWSQGQFPENKGQFGAGGLWHAARTPLSSLLDAETIRELVTKPLRDKYAEAFRPAATASP